MSDPVLFLCDHWVYSDFNKWVTKTHVSLKLRKIKFYFFNIKILKLTEYFLHDKNSQNSQNSLIFYIFLQVCIRNSKKSHIFHMTKSHLQVWIRPLESPIEIWYLFLYKTKIRGSTIQKFPNLWLFRYIWTVDRCWEVRWHYRPHAKLHLSLGRMCQEHGVIPSHAFLLKKIIILLKCMGWSMIMKLTEKSTVLSIPYTELFFQIVYICSIVLNSIFTYCNSFNTFDTILVNWFYMRIDTFHSK